MIEDPLRVDQFDLVKYLPDFFSVLLPELGRPACVERCVEHLHQHADMPMEIIVHDDGSGKDKQQRLLNNLNGKVSTLLFNQGHNLGLAASFNRCRAAATSKYLLGLNVDTYITSPVMKRMKVALDLPYVGLVVPQASIEEGPGVYTSPEGVKVALKGQMGCHCVGIRADVWDSVGGWNTNVQTTASDVGFCFSVFRAGYLTVAIEGTKLNEMWLPSGENNPNHVSSAEYTTGARDNGIPPIFGIPPEEQINLARNRKDAMWRNLNHQIQKDPVYPSIYNTAGMVPEREALLPTDSSIDWNVASKYGLDRWKDRITSDFNLA